MSYDLIFLRREPGQSWQDALIALEGDDADEIEDLAELGDGDDLDEPGVDPAIWRQIVEGARRIQPSIEEDGDELVDDLSIQIYCWTDEAGISVPYWYAGASARTVVTRMYEYAAVVAQASGLEGYDPQLELPLDEAAQQIDAAVSVFELVAQSFADRGIRPPSSES